MNKPKSSKSSFISSLPSRYRKRKQSKLQNTNNVGFQKRIQKNHDYDHVCDHDRNRNNHFTMSNDASPGDELSSFAKKQKQQGQHQRQKSEDIQNEQERDLLDKVYQDTYSLLNSQHHHHHHHHHHNLMQIDDESQENDDNDNDNGNKEEKEKEEKEMENNNEFDKKKQSNVEFSNNNKNKNRNDDDKNNDLAQQPREDIIPSNACSSSSLPPPAPASSIINRSSNTTSSSTRNNIDAASIAPGLLTLVQQSVNNAISSYQSQQFNNEIQKYKREMQQYKHENQLLLKKQIIMDDEQIKSKQILIQQQQQQQQQKEVECKSLQRQVCKLNHEVKDKNECIQLLKQQLADSNRSLEIAKKNINDWLQQIGFQCDGDGDGDGEEKQEHSTTTATSCQKPPRRRRAFIKLEVPILPPILNYHDHQKQQKQRTTNNINTGIVHNDTNEMSYCNIRSSSSDGTSSHNNALLTHQLYDQRENTISVNTKHEKYMSVNASFVENGVQKIKLEPKADGGGNSTKQVFDQNIVDSTTMTQSKNINCNESTAISVSRTKSTHHSSKRKTHHHERRNSKTRPSPKILNYDIQQKHGSRPQFDFKLGILDANDSDSSSTSSSLSLSSSISIENNNIKESKKGVTKYNDSQNNTIDATTISNENTNQEEYKSKDSNSMDKSPMLCITKDNKNSSSIACPRFVTPATTYKSKCNKTQKASSSYSKGKNSRRLSIGSNHDKCVATSEKNLSQMSTDNKSNHEMETIPIRDVSNVKQESTDYQFCQPLQQEGNNSKSNNDSKWIQAKESMQISKPEVTASIYGNGKDTTTAATTSNNVSSNSYDSANNGPSKKPAFKYQEVVRGKKARQALRGRSCECCSGFINAVCNHPGGNVFDKKMFETSSRHRSEFTPPKTPPDFWELSFIDERDAKKKSSLTEKEKNESSTRGFMDSQSQTYDYC